ncbi:MAG: PAS domain-containing protein [candidate division Zixibacteria bacterium]|nr:PAS domain-containing protein [candidate division Zixibacteria bacterium]
MKTVIIGGGRACREIIELASGTFMRELRLEIACVMDSDPDATGMVYARKEGINTTTDIQQAMETPGIELVLELTGRDEVLKQIHKIIPLGVKLIDHTIARIFWDLLNAQTDQMSRIDELARLEEKLDKERNFLQLLVDSIPELIVVLDKDKKAMRVNRSFSNYIGIEPEEAVGKTCRELFEGTDFEDHCEREVAMLDDTLRTGESFSSIWIIPPPNEIHWEVTRTPLISAEGRPEGILATWHRITDQVMLRREIETAEERFRSFIDSAHDWISMKDLEGRYIIVNPVTASAFGHEPEDFFGKKADEVLPKKLAKLIQKHDQEVIECNCHRSYEEVIPIEGRDHYFQTVRFPLQDYNGSALGVCTIMRDVTSEKELRDQLVQSSKLVAIGQLAAGVAHEINNPLTGILAYAEDMEEDLNSHDEHYEDIAVIIRETKRCRDIVKNLLDFARQEAPKLEEINPNQIVNQALSLVEKLPQFRNIEIEMDIAQNIPLIQCDQQQIQQVLLNLMLNAADAMKGKGRITLTTRYGKRQDRCMISVEDNGPGIPENLIDKIFEPFFSTKGTNGLGLAVSWGIVERHRGTIEVDMADEGGAIFNIVLPAYHKS